MRIKKRLRWLLLRNMRLCNKLNRSQKFFYFGAIFLILSGFWYLTPFKYFSLVSLIACLILLLFGVISDILIIYSKIWSTSIGKGFVLILYAAITNLAYAFSSQIVNEVIAFDASNLNYTLNFVTLLLLPILIFFITYIVFLSLMLFGQIYIVISVFAKPLIRFRCFKSFMPTKLESYPFSSFLARIVVYPVIIGLFWVVSIRYVNEYAEWIEDTTKSFIYNFEAKKYSRCIHNSDEKIIKLTDSEIMTVKKFNGDYTFSPKICVARLK